jgi:hypothetical protein
MSVSVQGMASQTAARALVCLFYPQNPCYSLSPPAGEQDAARSLINLFAGDSAAQPWQFLYFHKSGSVAEDTIVYLRLASETRMWGRGVDSTGPYVLRGSADRHGYELTWFFHKTYVSLAVWPRDEPSDGPPSEIEFLLESSLEPPAEMILRPHISHCGYWSEKKNCVGSGAVSSSSECSSSRSNDMEDGPDHLAWRLLRSHGEAGLPEISTALHSSSETLDITGATHFAVTAAEEAVKCPPGLGFYGVWEGASTGGSHFELQRGGVFRAVPLSLSLEM